MSERPPVRLRNSPPPPPLPNGFPPEVFYYEAEPKKKTSVGTWIVAVIALFFGIAYILGEMRKDTPEGKQASFEAKVKRTAMEVVRSRLKDGDGASFDSQSIGYKERLDGDFHVWGNVRASNSFGAVLNNSWQVVIRETDGERWTVLWVKIGDVPAGGYLPDVAPEPAE